MTSPGPLSQGGWEERIGRESPTPIYEGRSWTSPFVHSEQKEVRYPSAMRTSALSILEDMESCK